MEIRQEIIFGCPPENIYGILSDAEQFASATDTSADFDAKAGGAFSCFDGMISGRFIELAPSELIVQAWRVGNWEPGVYSIVRFDLEATENGKTKLVMNHTGFPEDHAEHLDKGWHTKYWEPIAGYLER